MPFSKIAFALRVLVLADFFLQNRSRGAASKFFVCRENLTAVVRGGPTPPHPCWDGQSWQEAAYTCPPSRQLSF